MVLGGDVMLNAVPLDSKPLTGIQSVLSAADVAIVNLEIPLTLAKTATTRKSAAELKARSQFILKAHPGHAAHLAEVGIDAVSLGNNHAMDYGREGLAEMLGALDVAGIASTGAGLDRAAAKRAAVIVLPNKLRIGLVSMLSYMTPGALWKCTPSGVRSAGVFDLNLAGVSQASRAARFKLVVAGVRRHADVVVVALHGGTERATVPTSYQVSLARGWIDAGADVVVGHHPHVLQGAELYKGRPVLYSTGNLVSPLSGSTALFRLTFDGAVLQRFETLPAKIAGGKTKFRSAGETKAERKRFEALGTALSKRFPHKEAQALGADWALLGLGVGTRDDGWGTRPRTDTVGLVKDGAHPEAEGPRPHEAQRILAPWTPTAFTRK